MINLSSNDQAFLMERFVKASRFSETIPQGVGDAAVILADALQWADALLISEDSLELRIVGAGVPIGGYLERPAQVFDPLKSTGKCESFFLPPVTARFVAVGWLFRGEAFHCSLSRGDVGLGRLRMRRLADIVLTRRPC